MNFKISLAQWSLHRSIWAKEVNGRDFPRIAREVFDIGAVEFVNHLMGGTTQQVFQLLKRPEISMRHLTSLLSTKPPEELEGYIESAVKYAGYIERQERDIKAVRDLDGKRIPAEFRYDIIAGLSKEAQQKLSEKRPETVGQASRISGVRAADLSIVVVHLERYRRERGRECVGGIADGRAQTG